MDPFLTVLGIYAGVTLFDQAKRYLKNRPRFRNANFGVGIASRAGVRSLFETILVERLCQQGAHCVLAGRRQVARTLADADVIDATGYANPDRAIIGTIIHLVEPGDDRFDFHACTQPAFQAWVRHHYPNSFTATGQFAETALVQCYQLTLFQLMGLFLEMYSQDPLLSMMLTTATNPIHIQISASCHTADGLISASFVGERWSRFDRLVPCYRRLVDELIDSLRISQPAKKPGVFSEQRLSEIFERVKAKLNERVYDDPVDPSGPPRPYIDPTRVALDRPDSR